VGGVVPELVDDVRTPYVALGAGYAALAIAVFLGGGLRQRRLEAAVERDGYEPAGAGWVAGLTAAGAALALATLAVILANA
jgi:hypothetical protein